MKRAKNFFRLFWGRIGFFLLFVLNFLYIFCSLGLFSFGLIISPVALLGILDILVIITDVGLPVLLVGGIGVLLLGGGMCLGIPFICKSSLNRLHYFRVGSEWRRRAEDK